MKNWYQSKKFWAAVIPLLLTLIDVVTFNLTGYHIPVEGIGAGLVMALSYLLVEGGLDAKRMKLQEQLRKVDPLADPLIKDLILSLIAHKYDFKKASADMGLHSGEVINQVMKSLAEMLNPDLETSQALRAEVARQFVKQFDQDNKLKEGFDLAKASGQ